MNIRNENGETEKGPLMTFGFVAICLVITVSFCSVSVFYSLYHYFEEIGIPPVWRGFLIGLEPMAAFTLRLLLLPWLHLRNALSMMIASLVLLFLVCLSYLWVTSVGAMIVLRVVHGAAIVLITAPAFALAVHFIPPQRSGEAFSILGIATMIPYAVIPPLFEALLPHVRNEADIYASISVFALIAALIVVALRGRIGAALKGADESLMKRPTLSDLRDNFLLPAVLLTLAATFLLYLAHATSFYFIKNLSLQTTTGQVGFFFTISWVMMIAVRVVGSSLFDRIGKVPVLQKAMALLVLCLGLLPHAASPGFFYFMAALYGLCMGVIPPLLAALLFTSSPPAMRGLNANVTLLTLDGAYFILPYLGGGLLALGLTFGFLFYAAAGFMLSSLLLITALRRRSKEL